MRRGFGFFWMLCTLAVIVVVGAVAYNVGLSDGAHAGVAPYYGPHFGGGGLGFLWFFFILFGLFWLFRIAFFGFWWGGGWRHHGWQDREERLQEWHRREHGAPDRMPPEPPPAPAP